LFFGLTVPEIWLNYGPTEVILDIQAENLEQNLNSPGKTIDDLAIDSELDAIDLSKPIELVVLNDSKSVQKIIMNIFEKCEKKSISKPKILGNKKILNILKHELPKDSAISEFNYDELSNSNLVFIDEIEFDGLFGFETVATRLVKKFGDDKMLSAYEKRNGNLPIPGQESASLEVAKEFSNMFEINAIEIASNSDGIIDVEVGHPSSSLSVSKPFADSAWKDVGKHRTLIVSTGKNSSNDTLGRSLTSVWNCYQAVKGDGMLVLVGECSNGIGSDSIQHYIEGSLNLERLKNPAKYIDGMQDLLFLTEIQKKINLGLVSILPEFYTKKLNFISFSGVKKVMEYILKNQGMKQKVEVVSDGARIILR